MSVTWKKLAYALEAVPYTGAIADVDLGTKTLASAGAMQAQTVDVGDTLTVPEDYSMVIGGPFVMDGALVLDGDMVIL